VSEPRAPHESGSPAAPTRRNAARHAIRRPRVARGPKRCSPCSTHREFVHIGFAEDDGAGRLQPFDHMAFYGARKFSSIATSSGLAERCAMMSISSTARRPDRRASVSGRCVHHLAG
jgi:hypothetical protein